MLITLIFIGILLEIEVFGNYAEDKPSASDETLEHFHVSPFLFDNESIHLNITWGNEFGNDSLTEVYFEIYDIEGECIYSSSDSISSYNIIIPNLDMFDMAESLTPGCQYTINITLDEQVITENYVVPECVENYCACITNRTNLIRLVNVESIEEYIYQVHYTSVNPNLEKGNYYITNIYYVKQDNEDRFDVPKIKYLKGAFEIPMEYLKGGQKYKLIVQYNDTENVNPICAYKSEIEFIAHVPSDDDYYYIVTIVSTSVFLFFTLVLLCFFVKWTICSSNTLAEIKKFIFQDFGSPRLENLKKTSFSLPHQEINTLYTSLETPEDPYEFPRENIVIKGVIGEGAFGQVYYAKAYNLHGVPGYTMVAVKLLREGAPKEELADFRAEIKMLKNIGQHKNVVKFLGCVTSSQPYLTVMELVANGDLKEYLLKLRDIWVKNKNKRLFFPDDMEEKHLSIKETDSDNLKTFDVDMQTPLLSDIGTRPEPVLDHRELENFALQIATGMAYLEKIPVTHRDLAARNILITKEKVLKISDFGMSRSGPYVNRSLRKVPLRWMAIESIQDFKTDNKSDVWSFGVVLWEIGTLGAFPYEDIPNDLILQALKSGVRLKRPEICSDDLFALMQRCWLMRPVDRPTFAEIVEHLNLKKQHVYVDFKRINPNYVFPPTDPK